MTDGLLLQPPNPFLEIEREALLNAPIRVDLRRHLRAALSQQKWAGPSCLKEIFSLRLGPGLLTVHEYFYYRLYEGTLSLAEKRAFVGKRAQTLMHYACNDPRWLSVVGDKLMFRTVMRALGLPIPALRAFYHPFRRTVEGTRLENERELAAFLRDKASYPVFAKPVDGMYSLGAFSLDGYDGSTDQLMSRDGSRIGVAEFVQGLGQCGRTYVFQERLNPHPEMAELFGDRLSTARFVVLVRGHGPELFRAVCKIPTGANIADNFWRTGNMLGAVDLDTGEIKRVVRGTGANHDFPGHHPDTGRHIIGRRLPNWSQVKDTCLAAAAALPAVRTQSWDVAISEKGPALVEVNFGGDLNLAQIAWGKGVLDEQYRAHLLECGYKGPLPPQGDRSEPRFGRIFHGNPVAAVAENALATANAPAALPRFMGRQSQDAERSI